MSSLIISSSGIRGIIGDTLDPLVAYEIAASFGSIIGKGPIILGGDTRVSHEMILNAVQSGLQSVGTDIINIGKVTTPTVQQMITIHNAKAGMVITASHNPIMWNGIKLMNESGSFLSADQYEQFIAAYKSKLFKLKSWDKIGNITYDKNSIEQHVDLILENIDTTSIKNSNLNVLCDANHGAGAVANPILFKKLGINYTMLHKEPNGKFAHDPEPLEKNISTVINEAKTQKYDISFIQDADADRLVILDENGRFIGEDYSLALCIDYVLGFEETSHKEKSVVVNLSTSKVISDIAKKHDASIHYTKIGEPNVTAKIKEIKASVGGEGNGGVIYPKIGWGRDSLVGMVLALNYIAKSKNKVSEIVSTYPKYVMLREKINLSNKDEINTFINKLDDYYVSHEKNKEDGIKIYFEHGWAHIRPSNTEPIVRIFIESNSIENGKVLYEEIKEVGK